MFVAMPPSVHTNLSEKRKRKLLMHKNEIIRWSTRVKERGLTILPIDVHTANNRIKLTIALVRKKVLHGDKKKLEEKITKREMRKY
jgi:tmRNA-binding protein